MKVALACNDEHGNESTLKMVEIGETAMTLEGDVLGGAPIDFRQNDFGLLMVHGWYRFRFTRRSRYVGNLCWDEFEMEPGEVVNLLCYLRSLSHWSCTAGESSLSEKWREGGAFGAGDFGEG